MAEPLWRWTELCTALGLVIEDGPDINGISIDSRQIAAGDLFIALTGDPGTRFNPSQRSDRDGHDFIEAALENGAAGVLSHDTLKRACPELKVADTLDALWALGAAARSRLGCPVVAITGSSGKTTTKSLLSAALDAFSTPGSLNNHLGVPISLARTPRNASAAVYEIGTNHPGEIAPLSELAQPDVAVLLNVHPAHAEFFVDLAELRTEKLSIYKGLREQGVLVVEDVIGLADLPDSVSTLRFGRTTDAALRLLDCSGERASYGTGSNELIAYVPGGGEHRAMSLAAVLAVLQTLQLDLDPALHLAADLVPKGRGNRIDVNGITLIDDSYNANPASMTAALKALQTTAGRKFALIGEMLELGEAAADYHSALAPLCRQLDGVFCVGEGMRGLADLLPDSAFYDTPDAALLNTLVKRLLPGDTLLIKGSNRVFWAREFVASIRKTLSA